MPDQKLTVYSFGEKGVNVDKDPLVLENNELRQAQNAIPEPDGGLRNRDGLTKFNDSAAEGSILGGIGVPLINLRSGTPFFYIGRGTL